MTTRPDPTPLLDTVPPDPRRWAVLILMGLALCVIVLNNSALNVAIPALMRDLGSDLSTVQWIVDSYSIVFAGLLVPAGSWSDRWGRKRLTLAGLVVFGVASVTAAFATEAWQLIVLRGALGAGAAFVMPGTLAILLHVFARHEHVLAISVWSGIAALGVALGPILGGLLVESFGWSAVFLLNVPLVTAVVLLAAVMVRESRDPAQRPTDALGAVLSVVAVGAFVFAVIEFGAAGVVDSTVLVAGVLAAGAVAGLLVRQRRARYPLVETALVTDRRFRGAAVSNMLLFFGLAGSLFVLTQRLQFQLGFDPFAAGLAVGPIALTVIAASVCSPVVAQRFGARTTVTAGMAVVAAGFLVLGLLGSDYPVIAAGLATVGIGFGLATPVATAVLVSAVPHDRASSGSALNDTMQELGFALGIAVVGATLNRWYVDGVGGVDGATLHTSLEAARRLGGVAGAEQAAQARAVFDHSAAAALSVAALAAVVGAIVAVRLLPARNPHNT